MSFFKQLKATMQRAFGKSPATVTDTGRPADRLHGGDYRGVPTLTRINPETGRPSRIVRKAPAMLGERMLPNERINQGQIVREVRR